MKQLNEKNQERHFSLLLIFLLAASSVSAQTTTTTNNRTSGSFLGWGSFGTSGSLEIRNDFTGSYPINFFTGGNSTTNQRMTILGSAGNGYVGIGSGFSTPQALLHINGYANAGNTGEVFRSSGPDDNLNAWQMYLNPLRIEAFE